MEGRKESLIINLCMIAVALSSGVLAVLKLSGAVEWSWLWVLAPAAFVTGGFVLFTSIVMILAVICGITKKY